MRNKLSVLGMALMILSLICSCTHTPEQIQARQELINRFNNMVVANDQMVQGCKYLGEVDCSSGNVTKCKQYLKKRAAQLGATHIVWQDLMHQGTKWGIKGKLYIYYITAIAYKCEGKESNE